MHLRECGAAISGNERPASGVRMWWLGQAGFLLRSAQATVLVDPYLSNSLASKYAHTRFPHIRMMPPPVQPGQLTDVSLVLCTHAHTDHMDPGTLPSVAKASPDARFVVPRAVRETAVERGVPESRLVDADAGEDLLIGGARVSVVPAAHEALETDEAGNHRFLGFVISAAGITFYHSGDTVPYAGQSEILRQYGVDVALLPINGRDQVRAENGIPGNMTLEEAVRLSEKIGARLLVCHHWGMFDFNTVDPPAARRRIAGVHSPAAMLPQIGRCYCLRDR